MNLAPLLSLPRTLTAILFSFLSNDPVSLENAAPSVKSAALTSFEQAVGSLEKSNRFWTAPYVLADLENKEVYVWGEHTGMIPGDPLEFFVISEDSGHDYEALMVSFAKPSDIHAALKKIGLKSGGPVDPDAHRFWPRGDRVQASILFQNPELDTVVDVPAESFCSWKGNPMPVMPWVFTGSPSLPSRDQTDDLVYAADEFPPNSIASTFNLRATVFDLPLQGSKTGVYGDFIFTPQGPSSDGYPLLLHLKPAPLDTYPTEKDLTLEIKPQRIQVDGLEEPFSGDLADLGSMLNQQENEVHFVTVSFSDNLSLEEAATRAQELLLLEKHVESIRIEPPPPEQVFFRSFVPDPRFRIRQNRPSQPLELHLGSDSTFLVELTEKWGESRVPEVIAEHIPLETPQDLISYLNEAPDAPKVLFIYMPSGMTLKEMRRWTQPIIDRVPVVFVYKKEG